ncbi:MAG: protein translocase subunit SecF, partial [Lapillicoccus sp.]
LVALVMAIYFRTWKMAVAGLVALIHDLVITVGVYALFGFEITPSSVIGFLTILGYSLYDTVVVFDKVRENTTAAMASRRQTYTQAANLAVNQTLVRSINTTVVALLPIAAILVVGVTKLGPGTLLDLSLALFVGIAVGAYSSIFIATPLLVDLRRGEPAIKELERVALRGQTKAASTSAAPVGAGVGASGAGAGWATRTPKEDPDTLEGDAPAEAESAIRADGSVREVHKWAQAAGPRNQPKRSPKSKR